MPLPTLEQYNEAAQNPASAFFDPVLQRGKVKTSGLGLPLAVCGGFALTYTIMSGASRYAVRCFHKDAKDREKRYDAISRKLSTLKSDYFVSFNFLKNGIRVKGQSYPIVKMEWAKGETIGEFVDANFMKKEPLLSLRHSILELAIFLEKNHIAHGDIQPGNLMVSDAGKSVQLIDYDGMYLPEIRHLTSIETGHRNFQHPDRARFNPWNERTDRFSFILLSIVLQALSTDPQLWIKSKSDGDKFLIGANDFVAPHSSKIFSELSSLPSINENISRFISICCGSYDAIPSPVDFNNTSFQIEVITQSPSEKVGYISTYPVLDANNYTSCLKHVGDVVELVGKVVDVHFGMTKWGKPYFFLNFADWRGDAVKISVWSNYLDKARNIDFNKLKGKFISVIGLMQPPYHGKSKHVVYNHLSIFLDTTLNEIDEKEAKYRLAYERDSILHDSQADVRGGKKSNKDILESIKNDMNNLSSGRESPLQKTFSASPSPHQQMRTNRNILNDIKNIVANQKSSSSWGTTSKCSVSPQPVVKCPVCLQVNKLGTSRIETIHCTSCGSIFEYTIDTHATRILNISQTKASSQSTNAPNAKSDVYIQCPYCHALNNVGRSGILSVSCIACYEIFEYSHFTHSIKWNNRSSLQKVYNQTDSTLLEEIKNDKSGWILLGVLLAFFLILILMTK